MNAIEFKSVSDQTARELIDNFESYTNNERLDLNRLYQPFSKEQQRQISKEQQRQKHIWYGCFEDGKCMAIALLKKIPKGFILLAEFQAVVKGYGKLLLEDILSKSKNIWWCADPEGGESLADYYRQFDLEEHLIKLSKWTNTQEYAFFKVTDEQHRKQILDQLDKADMTSEKYDAKCL